MSKYVVIALAILVVSYLAISLPLADKLKSYCAQQIPGERWSRQKVTVTEEEIKKYDLGGYVTPGNRISSSLYEFQKCRKEKNLLGVLQNKNI